MAKEGPFSFLSQAFNSGLVNKLPYQKGTVIPNIEVLNPKFNDFDNATAKRATALKKHSISTPKNIIGSEVAVKALISKGNALLYQSASEQKAARLKEYNTLASFENVKDAIEEIANEFFNPDEKGRFANLIVKNKDDKPETKELLNEEFEKYIGYFNFEDKGTRYVKQFLKEGELFFEQVVHEDYMEDGVLGVEIMAANLIEPLYINVVTEELDAFTLKRPIYDLENANTITGFDLIPMSKGQVVYIHSDDWNVEHTFRIPHVDACRKAFRQLSMIEDSILIYRMVNAPERLVFNIDVGNMPGPKAEEYLQRISMEYWSNRSFDPSKGDIVNQYNPQSMLDAFWFPRRTGSDGSKVEKLAAGQNLGELTDLNYFAQKLYKSLKVPVSRLQSDNTYRDGTDILREELKFAAFVMDLQKQFARAIRQGFITHLKLKGLMSKLDVRENELSIKFLPPTNFYDMREAKRMEMRIGNYQNMTSDGAMSKTLAQKEYLKWTDEQIKANLHLRRLDAANEWEISKILANGPKWMEIESAAQQPSPAEGGMPSGGAPGVPPNFSGGPVDTNGGASAQDGAATTPANPGSNPTEAAFGGQTQSESPDAGDVSSPDALS